MSTMLRRLLLMTALPVAVPACGDSTPNADDAAVGAADAAVDAPMDIAPDAGDAAGDAPEGTPDSAADTNDGSDVTEVITNPPSGPGPLFLPPSEPGRHTVSIVDNRQIVPSDGLPDETPAGNSNNNLDVVRFDGRTWLAWRTAPDHFASPEARIHIVSSDDEVTWRHEASFARDTDLREPRLLVLNGTLLLYLAELGNNALGFEPRGTLVSTRASDGTWSELQGVGPETLILWRTRVVGERPMLIGYTGGANIYLFNGIPLDVHLFTTTDGLTLTPFDDAHPIVLSGGGSEADFALSDAGELFAVVRNEAGDSAGWGSHVCRAPAGNIADWSCRTDPRKYDSPLMFWHDGEAYLVGRRNLTDTGDFDLFEGAEFAERAIRNQLDYSNQPKRCSLWRYDTAEDRIAFVLDLPSKGDTCFASVLPGEVPDELVLYNYSSPWDGDDEPTWVEGQRAETRVYRHVLRFTPR